MMSRWYWFEDPGSLWILAATTGKRGAYMLMKASQRYLETVCAPQIKCVSLERVTSCKTHTRAHQDLVKKLFNSTIGSKML